VRRMLRGWVRRRRRTGEPDSRPGITIVISIYHQPPISFSPVTHGTVRVSAVPISFFFLAFWSRSQVRAPVQSPSLGRTRDTPTLVHLASLGHHRGSISPWIIRPIALRAACTQPIKCVGIPGVFPRLTRDTLHRLANTVVHRAITTPREGRPLIRFREFADGLLCRFWGPGPSFKGRHPDLSTGCRE